MVETMCPTCNKTRKVSRNIKPRNCYSCASKLSATPEKRKKQAEAAKITLNGFKKGHKFYDFDKTKHRESVRKGALKRYSILENRLKASLQGKRLVQEGKCPFWKGGLTELNKIIRQSAEYAIWRQHVFQRDDYTCQACGQRGGKLQADHELPFSLYPDLRFEILNGRTLCEECHNKTDTYGKKMSTYELTPMGK